MIFHLICLCLLTYNVLWDPRVRVDGIVTFLHVLWLCTESISCLLVLVHAAAINHVVRISSFHWLIPACKHSCLCAVLWWQRRPPVFL